MRIERKPKKLDSNNIDWETFEKKHTLRFGP